MSPVAPVSVKRLIGVVTVKDGRAVQSIGYRRHLPLGRPEVLIDNLDRWGVDEILLQCIDRAGRGPDVALLERLSRQGLSTPLIYQGGVRSVEEGVRVVQTGAERIACDALLRDAPEVVAALAEPLGAQALIAALPLSIGDDGALLWLDARSGRSAPIPPAVLDLLASGTVSEALVIDWRNEGRRGGFDTRLVDAFALPAARLIAFGGLSEPAQLRALLERPRVVAAAVGNFLNYSEHAVQTLKRGLHGLPMRAPAYEAHDAHRSPRGEAA